MTFRTRTAPKPTRRRARRSDTRRAIYITLAFTLAIACAVSLMGGVFLAGYYTDHGAPIAAVNGEAISKDAVRDRANLNLARFERQLADYQTHAEPGQDHERRIRHPGEHVQTSEAQSTLYSNALTQLINEAEIRQYAAKNNITVTDQQVDAQIKLDSTTPEMRHVKIISVAPKTTPPASSPTSGRLDRRLAQRPRAISRRSRAARTGTTSPRRPAPTTRELVRDDRRPGPDYQGRPSSIQTWPMPSSR